MSNMLKEGFMLISKSIYITLTLMLGVIISVSSTDIWGVAPKNDTIENIDNDLNNTDTRQRDTKSSEIKESTKDEKESNSKTKEEVLDRQEPQAKDKDTETVSSDEKVKVECSKNTLIPFFPQIFVKQALKKYNVPEDKWIPIMKELAIRDKDVIKLTEAKAQKMKTNPLKDPAQREAAVKLFRESLLEVYGESLEKNGVKDPEKIRQTLEFIQKKKAKHHSVCFGTEEEDVEEERSDENSNNPETEAPAK